MNDLSKYENIIFDLGVVIINLDFSRTVDAFEKLIPNLDRNTFLGRENQDPFFSQFETGKISAENFFQKFLAKYKIKMSFSEFAHAWNAMILDIPMARIKILQNLKKRGKKIYLLSNINALHEIEVEKKFQALGIKGKFHDLFDNAYYSHHIGFRKPEPESYEYVIAQNGLDKNKTVFIDDLLTNVLAARKVGLDAIHLEKEQKIENLELFRP